MLPYFMVCIAIIYIIPLIDILVTGIYGLIFGMLFLYIPVTYFIISLIYGKLNEFKPFSLLFPIIAGILFIPAAFIYYNHTAIPYSYVYIIIAFIGYGIGSIVRK